MLVRIRKAAALLLLPVTISLVLVVLLSVIFVPFPPGYRVVMEKVSEMGEGRDLFLYDDLDGNGYSDSIFAFHYSNGISGVSVVFEPDVFLQEWDFRGRFRFTNSGYLGAGDFDHDGTRELYAFTVSGDSILLNIISDLFNKNPSYSTRFIDRFGIGCDSIHAAIFQGEPEDLNGDGYDELIFAVNAGFSLTPRRVYAYDIRHDSLWRSPPSGYHILQLLQADITGDGKKEIIVNGYASQNYKTPLAAIDDRICWLMVLDTSLNFLFPPVPFPDTGYSALITLPLPNGKGYSDMYALYIPPLNAKKLTSLYHFDRMGKVLNSVELPGCTYSDSPVLWPTELNRKPLLAVADINGNVVLYDTSFNMVDRFSLDYNFRPVGQLNLDDDSLEETVSMDPVSNRITIVRNDPRKPAWLNVNLSQWQLQSLSCKKSGNGPPLLSLQTGSSLYLISYGPNPMRRFIWVTYAGIFLFILMFILIIRRITRIQMLRRFNTERKITELQMKVVRNQMDPHFTMNAINAAIGAVQKEDKEAATKALLHFSRMYRALVLSGDKIERTLAEELEFSEHYLELERFRAMNRFEYRVEIEPGVDMESVVPKMIIQTPVENAVKHGLLSMQTGGVVTIRAFVRNGSLRLEIEDNGAGRAALSRKSSAGTGKGLKIMDEFLTLYEKVRGIRIEVQIIDLYLDNGTPGGTRVVFTIPLK